MKTILTLLTALLAASSSATPTAEDCDKGDNTGASSSPCTADNPCNAFTVRAFRNGSVIHQKALHASGYGLWLDKPTVTTCPSYLPQCPTFTTTVTAFYCVGKTGNPTTCGMSVVVPEGQDLYVDPADGVIHYTAPGRPIPNGAFTDGFQYVEGQNGQPGIFQFIGNSSEGLVACATQKKKCNLQTGRHCGPWSVRAAFPSLDQSHCVLIGGVAVESNKAAWQYN
jgi:hypothetical protein